LKWTAGIPAAALVVVGFVFVPSAESRVIQVPDDSDTIADALAAAEDGDLVAVAPGVYREHDLRLKAGVSLEGTTGVPEDVVIDAEGQGRVLICEGVGADVTVSGLTFRNGFATGPTEYDRSGGAVFFSHSEPRIASCVFVANVASAAGGAVRVTYASPQLIACRFVDNRAATGGGAIDCSLDANPVFDSCHFEGNESAWGGAISARVNAHPTVNSCTFFANRADDGYGYGGGFYCDFESESLLDQCILQNNEGIYGGAVAVFDKAQLMLRGSTIVGNTAQERGHALYTLDSMPVIQRCIVAYHPGQPVVCEGIGLAWARDSDLWGNGGEDWNGAIYEQRDQTGNFSADPVFCDADPLDWDLTLESESPCLPENSPRGMLVGALDVGCGITPLNLILLQATPVSAGIEIEWQVRGAAAEQEFQLEGQFVEGASETWLVPFENVNASLYRANDRSVAARTGGAIEYTLYTRIAPAPWSRLGTIATSSGELQPLVVVSPASPNPFNPGTQITFDLVRTAHVRVRIHDISGRTLAQLADSEFGPGAHAVRWDGRDDDGHQLPSGAYIAVFEVADERLTQKLTLVR
jgi:hypothetical protein